MLVCTLYNVVLLRAELKTRKASLDLSLKWGKPEGRELKVEKEI
jgi:hypothetical protein